MINKKRCIAMILAGGQGSRLYCLTQRLAKPAVAYGGKYRLIDFPLSNCVNSGIDTVGVLTQYQPLVLNEYIGNGQPWDLDRTHGGVFVLPPYQSNDGSDWYSGSANAIYQNMHFIDRYDPDYVIVLGGDHVYKMDYEKMLRSHEERGADCTIAVTEVTLEEARGFGIMNCRDDDSIYEFEEKPPEPKSLLASMGIYIFNTDVLRKFLTDDAANPDSVNDFGKNIITSMLGAGCAMYAYRFEGYWKDVGTIDSLWEANMDLLDPAIPLDLSDSHWKIYARNSVRPPQYIAPNAKIQNTIVSEGTEVYGQTEFSVLFPNVIIEPGAQVHDSIIMNGSVIRSGALVEYSIIAENTEIGENARIGRRPEDTPDKESWGVTVIASNMRIGKGAVIGAKQMVDVDIPDAVTDGEVVRNV